LCIGSDNVDDPVEHSPRTQAVVDGLINSLIALSNP
jgi:hypothetical protein